MAEKLRLMYGIVRERGIYTETTVCTIKFLQMVFREYNVLPLRTFDDFLDALYSQGSTYIVTKSHNLWVKVLIGEDEEDFIK